MAYKVQPQMKGTSVVATKSDKTLGGTGVAFLLPDNLTKDQYAVLNKAYTQAKQDGHKSPEILQGILLQETKAGAMRSYKVAGQELNSKEKYYGLGQIKLGAAKDVLKTWPELYSKYGFHTKEDEEIIAHLILNDDFNIEVASKYLKLLRDRSSNKSDNFIIAAYNRGLGGAKELGNQVANFHYVKGVRNFITK